MIKSEGQGFKMVYLHHLIKVGLRLSKTSEEIEGLIIPIHFGGVAKVHFLHMSNGSFLSY